MNENWIRSNILSSILAIYLEKGLLKPFVLLRKKHIDPATQPAHELPQSFNATSPCYCHLPSAFFSGLYIFSQDSRKYWSHFERCSFDNISAPMQVKKKNQTKLKKRQNRKEKERLIWEFCHLVFGFRCRALVIFWRGTIQNLSSFRAFRFLVALFWYRSTWTHGWLLALYILTLDTIIASAHGRVF